MDQPFDIRNIALELQHGKKLYVRARFNHIPDPLEENIGKKIRIINEGEEGLVLALRDLDAPDHESSWGWGLYVNWGDVNGRYIEHWLINGVYLVKEGIKILPPIDSYKDFFNVSRIE